MQELANAVDTLLDYFQVRGLLELNHWDELISRVRGCDYEDGESDAAPHTAIIRLLAVDFKANWFAEEVPPRQRGADLVIFTHELAFL